MDNIFEALPDSKVLQRYMAQRHLIDDVEKNWTNIFGKLAKDLRLVTIKDDTIYEENLYFYHLKLNHF